ncbi:MAG: SGNH/GDSL hydrolase family protein [Thermoleophilia bacterium]|nr:SGNH/GDSL hydrolase family protein [Thermoleophilia bacterium]
MPRTIRALPGLLVAGLLFLSGCGLPFGGDDRPADWTEAPVVPEITGDLKDQFLEDVAAADIHGMRPDVFAKIGDSNTELRRNLFGFGCSVVEYGDQGDLAPTVEKFKETEFAPDLALPECQPANSFSRFSAAARSGTLADYAAVPLDGPPNSLVDRTDRRCRSGETLVGCEIREIQPRYMIAMSGTNDLAFAANLGVADPETNISLHLALLAARIRLAGSVPVLSTLPPIYITSTPDVDEWGEVKKANAAIYEAGRDLEIPVINLWSALTEDQMIDHGLDTDGVHLNVYGGVDSPDLLANSVNLTDEALRYGANRRNLIWVQTLKALDEAAESK